MFSQNAASPIFEKGEIGMFGNKYQGDIKLSKAQEIILLGNNPINQSTKTGWTWEGFRWRNDTNGLVVVPYTFDYSEGFCKKWNIFVFIFYVEHRHFQRNEKSRLYKKS